MKVKDDLQLTDEKLGELEADYDEAAQLGLLDDDGTKAMTWQEYAELSEGLNDALNERHAEVNGPVDGD